MWLSGNVGKNNTDRAKEYGWLFMVLIGGSVLLSGYALHRHIIRSTSCAEWEGNTESLGLDGVVRQTKPNTCGPAALKMILDHYGLVSNLEELENNSALTSEGISMMALKRIAEQYGLQAAGWKLSPNDLSGISFPAIFFVRGNHYVVADSFANATGLYLRDPSCGRMLVRREMLFQSWSGESIVFSHNAMKPKPVGL
jgi:predicted double-glycine peptidase